MSLLASFTKKPKLTAAHQHTAQARKSEGGAADALFNAAYSGYAEVLLDDPMRAEALYSWGFALLHQAKSKAADEAIKIYQDAVNKFAFCMLINPDYLGAAINGGVAFMDLARLHGAAPEHAFYDQAKAQFEIANRIQKGTASYNLACIYALRGDHDAALTALRYAQERGSLPDAVDILSDPDLDCVKQQAWFVDFIGALDKKPEAVGEENAEAAVNDETSQAAAEKS
jgi:tetratricopeptide (TPR) repeat protein